MRSSDEPRELRIHGVGEHPSLSAQGSGTLVGGTARPGVDVYEEPPRPSHVLRFVNWTRTSRYRIDLSWYLSLPFTLVNVAGYMRPRTGPVWPHRLIVLLAGILLSVGTWLWGSAVFETAIAALVYDADAALLLSRIAAGLVWAFVCWLHLRPIWPRKQGRSGFGNRRQLATVSALQLLAVTAVAVAAVVRAPGATTHARSLPAELVDPESFRCLLGTSQACLVLDGDWLTVAALGSCLLAAVLALLLVLLQALIPERTWRGTPALPQLTAAAVVFATVAILHLGGSAARLATAWLAGVIAPVVDARLPGQGPHATVLLVSGGGLSGPDVVLAAATPLILAALVLMVLRQLWASLIRPLLPTAPISEQLRKEQRLHDRMVESRPIWLFGIVLAAVLGVVFAGAAWVSGVADQKVAVVESGGWWDTWTAGVTDVALWLALVGILLFLLLPALRRPLAMIGDMVGYWDVNWHPMAAIPYRNDVVEVLHRQIRSARGRVMLVGHSQGGVLAFEALRRLGTGFRDRVDLVTCGSPLVSLYSRFFPFFFGPEQLEQVTASVGAWRNFWRDTDALASELFEESTELRGDERIPDPAPGVHLMPGRVQRLRTHHDYWIEHAQRAWIEQRLALEVQD